MVMETGWITYMAQQYQLVHEDELLSLSKSIPCKDNHLVRMYSDTEYSYKFNSEQSDISLCLNLEINVLKQVSKGQMPLGKSIAKIRTILMEYLFNIRAK